MSMPSFPENGANMTREQALTMIIASVAMEEQALSRILHAEGEKLRCILDRYKDACGCKTPKEILDANKSVTRLLETVAQNQLVLRDKLALAIEAGGQCPPAPPCPPEPPEPPCRPEPPEPPCRPEPPCPIPEPPCPPPEPPCLAPPPPCPSLFASKQPDLDMLEP